MISIVIPTVGRKSLQRLVDSITELAKQESLRIGVDFEIIVSCDPKGGVVSRSPVYRRLQAPQPGVNNARNHGARASRGEILWFLDDDTVLCRLNSLVRLQRAFRDERLLACGGSYLSDESADVSQRGYNALCSMWRASAGEDGREQLLGGTLAVRKDAWKKVGGFDSSIEYGGSETSFVRNLIALCESEKSSRVSFENFLSVTHVPGARAFADWFASASKQGRQKRTTSQFLPAPSKRISRSVSYLKDQDLKTIYSLSLFSVPYLAVSSWSARRDR